MASSKDAAVLAVEAGPPSSVHGDANEKPLDPIEERRLVRKLDFIVFPVFFVIYTMSFLDRINISNAKIQGMAQELDLYGNRFNVALFVRLGWLANTVYVAFPPANHTHCIGVFYLICAL